MALPNTNISITQVRNYLPYPSLDLGTLCLASTINEWSKYKPVIYNALTLTTALRNSISGFRVSGMSLLYYARPTGGSSSPYRLGDFRGYDKTARRPQSIVVEQDAFVAYEGALYGGVGEFIFNIPLPNMDVVHMWENEAYTYANTISIYDENGVVLDMEEGLITSEYDGKARVKLTNITNSSPNALFGIKIDLSDIGVGMKFEKHLQLWFGHKTDESYKRFRIPGMETMILKGTIIPIGVLIIPGVLPMYKFPPLDVTNSMQDNDRPVTYNYNPVTKTLTINSVSFKGNMAEDTDSTSRNKFENGTDWWFEYMVVDSTYNVIIGWTLLTSDVTGSTNIGAMTYTASAYISGGIVLNNIQNGYRINIQLRCSSTW